MSATTEADARIEQLEQRVDDLEAELEEKEDHIKEQAERIDELEAEVQEYRDHNERDKAKVKKRVTNLETHPTEDADPDDDPHDGAAPDESSRRETPLAQIVQLPEPLAQQELTANQQRARFVAKDILDYATKVPAGLVVTSSDIRKILAAKEDGTPHTETVSRVMTFLDRFGQDDVKVVKRNGIRRVAFTEEAAERYHDAGARDQDDITGVVMGKTTG